MTGIPIKLFNRIKNEPGPRAGAKRVLALVALFLMLSVPARAADLKDLSRGVLLYLPFDGHTTPRYAAGGIAVSGAGVSYAPGQAEEAAQITSSEIQIPAMGNMARGRGTISFWVRPAWTPDEAGYTGDRLLLGTANFSLNYHRANQTLYFMTGAVLPVVGYKWDYSTRDQHQVANWKAGQWHHVALTWDADTGKKILYLDGKAVSSQTTNLIRQEPFNDGATLTLGGAHVPGRYDELIIWDHPLSAEQIALLAQRPAEVAKELDHDLPPLRRSESWPVDFSIYQAEPEQTIVDPGQTFVAKIPEHNNAGRAFDGSVNFVLVDFWLKPRQTRTIELHLGPGERRTLDVPFVAPESGIFKVSVVLKQNGKTFRKDVASFAAFPKLSKPLSDNSFFGYHVNSWSEGMVQQAARLGVNWNRDHNMLQATWWNRVEPEPGQFEWTYQFQYDRMVQYHINVLGQFFGMPYWAAAGRNIAKPTGDVYPFAGPCNLDAFRTYVARTVAHYKNIHYWEVWNEPDVSIFWKGTPEEFARLCQVAYKTAKRANPGITVINGGYTRSSWRWAEEAAKAGALKYADGISYHAYYPAGLPPEELEQKVKDQLNFWHGLAKKYAGHDLPIWDTEGGSADTTWLEGYESPRLPPPDKRAPMDWRQATLAAVQTAAFLQAGGVVRSFQYLWNGASAGNYEGSNALDMDDAPKPKLIARVVMARELDGAKVVGVIHRPEARFYANVYEQKPDQSIVLMWTGRGAQAEIQANWPGKLLRRVDIMGNDRPIESVLSLGEEPVYLHVAADAKLVLAALKSATINVVRQPKPLPIEVKPGSEPPDVPTLPPYAAPSENTAAVFTVNLRPYVNMGLADAKPGDGVGGWTDEGPMNDMRQMPVGKQTFYGVPFDIINPAKNDGKSVLTLRGKILTASFPEKVTIPLPPGRVRCLYFLHAAGWGVPGRIGEYVIHYQDGKLLDLPLLIPENTNNWWTGYNAAELSRPVPVRVTNTKDGKPAWRYLRVWEWQNPRRDVPVTGVDVISADHQQTPILIAITGVRG